MGLPLTWSFKPPNVEGETSKDNIKCFVLDLEPIFRGVQLSCWVRDWTSCVPVQKEIPTLEYTGVEFVREQIDMLPFL